MPEAKIAEHKKQLSAFANFVGTPYQLETSWYIFKEMLQARGKSGGDIAKYMKKKLESLLDGIEDLTDLDEFSDDVLQTRNKIDKVIFDQIEKNPPSVGKVIYYALRFFTPLLKIFGYRGHLVYGAKVLAKSNSVSTGKLENNAIGTDKKSKIYQIDLSAQ